MLCREINAVLLPTASRALATAALAGLLGLAACDSSDEPEAPASNSSGASVTSSVVKPDMTREVFAAMCDQKGGSLETHPHCGGDNSCKGFSYDMTTHVFSEHTCKGLNTCTGFSCVLP